MEIRLYERELYIQNKTLEMELIKKTKLEMHKDLDFGGFIVIDGKAYRHCIYSRDNDVLAVKPVELDEQGREIEYEADFTCPYCGSVDPSAFELSNEGETKCGSCMSELQYERVITVEYNVQPINCAPITVIKEAE